VLGFLSASVPREDWQFGRVENGQVVTGRQLGDDEGRLQAWDGLQLAYELQQSTGGGAWASLPCGIWRRHVSQLGAVSAASMSTPLLVSSRPVAAPDDLRRLHD